MSTTTITKKAPAKAPAKQVQENETPAKKVPAKAPTKAPAKKAAAKVPAKKVAKKAPAKKVIGPKDDAITRHIAQAFNKLPSGTFLKAREITNTLTKEFPKADQRPSDVTVYSRCHSGRLPSGLTGQKKPCGATKA